ncbi:MAG: amidohydrolase family protein [Geminicoccaceae bacterium]
MPKIADPHHHLWERSARPYPWLAEPTVSALIGDTTPLCRDYLLPDYRADASGVDLVKSVHLQAEIAHDLSVEETAWLQSVADAPGSGGFPHGIVGFADLSAPDVSATLDRHASHRNFRGIRQILNRHPNKALAFTERDFMKEEAWNRGLADLGRRGFSFDLQVYPPQLVDAAQMARRHKDMLFVLNHTGMPQDRSPAGLETWRKGMEILAGCPNVAVKISGLGMTDHHWTVDSIKPFVMRTLDLFGVERCMFASNFPVDKLFGDYTTLWTAFDTLTEGFSPAEREALFHDNAVHFYRL